MFDLKVTRKRHGAETAFDGGRAAMSDAAINEVPQANAVRQGEDRREQQPASRVPHGVGGLKMM